MKWIFSLIFSIFLLFSCSTADAKMSRRKPLRAALTVVSFPVVHPVKTARVAIKIPFLTIGNAVEAAGDLAVEVGGYVETAGTWIAGL